MIIPIDDTTRIKSDKYNWTVENLIGSKEPTWKADAFFGTAQRAIKYCCDQEIRIRRLTNRTYYVRNKI